MKRSSIFIILSALVLFFQAHAVNTSALRYLIGTPSELKVDAVENSLAGSATMVVGGAIATATLPLASFISAYHDSPDAGTATMLVGLSLSFLAVSLDNFYFSPIALKKALKAQKILDSLNN